MVFRFAVLMWVTALALMAQVTTNTPITKTFDDDWWASQPAAVQACRASNVSTLSKCTPEAALKIAQTGTPVDLVVVVWGSSPWLAHLMRSNYGIPFVGSMEGIGMRGGLDPDRPMNVPVERWSVPAGKIPTVYFDPADEKGTLDRLHALYPLPPPAPKPVTVPVGTALVGAWWGGNYWGPGPGASDATVENGKDYEQGGKTFTAVKSRGLMNPLAVTIYFLAK